MSLRAEDLANRVPRDLQIRAISLIVFPLAKCSRRTRPIVSTITIPTTRSQPERVDCQSYTRGGHFWTPIPFLGVKLHAE